MAETQWKYYLGRGPEVDDILARAGKAKNDVASARHDLLEEYEANGFLPGDKHRYTVIGLLYFTKPAFEFMKYTLSESKTADGREYYIARPFLRHSKGKELAEKLASPAVTIDPANNLINLLGMSCMASIQSEMPQGGQTVVWSDAVQKENIVLVRLPANAPRQRILGAAPKIPPYLKLIKKEMYDALMGGDFSVLQNQK
ncbi:MAG: hypothetical protein Q4F72_12795 [Desulfovibrionaceae bacterium]|nr:hypothetical protein [Desulfovibrionaceae bacterium]